MDYISFSLFFSYHLSDLHPVYAKNDASKAVNISFPASSKQKHLARRLPLVNDQIALTLNIYGECKRSSHRIYIPQVCPGGILKGGFYFTASRTVPRAVYPAPFRVFPNLTLFVVQYYILTRADYLALYRAYCHFIILPYFHLIFDKISYSLE